MGGGEGGGGRAWCIYIYIGWFGYIPSSHGGSPLWIPQNDGLRGATGPTSQLQQGQSFWPDKPRKC